MGVGEWLTPLRIITLVIGFTLIEGAALWMYRRATGKGVSGRDFTANWISGLCLMCALRSAVVDAWWVWVAIWMLGSGVAHWSDLWARWQR
jgi:hypothetical protein